MSKILMALVVAVSAFCACTSQRLPATASFTGADCNLGLLMSSDSIHSFSIELRNTGDSVLKIKDVLTSCDCTGARPESFEIEPGKSTSITVTYNSSERVPGEFRQGVRIESNAVNGPVTISISGFVHDVSGQFVTDTTSIAYKRLSAPVINFR